jgi:sugar (pentulose or hexulose) kinase
VSGRWLLAFDLGAESGRAMLGAFDGRRLGLREAHRFANEPVEVAGQLQWDVLRLWAEIASGLHRGAALAGGDLASVGVDTWAVDYGLLDARGRLVANPVHYRDRRTEGMRELAAEAVPEGVTYRTTGIQFMPINTLFQLYAQVRQEDPQLEWAERLLFMPDLFHHWMSGSKSSEFSVATTSQCYDPTAGSWASELLARLGIPARLFAPVVASGTDLGPLLPHLREDGRLGGCRVIAPGAHDTASAVAAVPFEGGGQGAAYISSGTWSLVGLEVPRPVISEEARLANLTNEGGVFGTFRLLKNVMGLWLLQECRRALAGEGEPPGYEELIRAAAAAPRRGIVVDPDQERFLRPGDMPGRIRVYCREHGEPEPEGTGELIRVVLESLALRYRWVIEQLERIAEHPVEVVHVVGGGARNGLLCQMTADACGRPVLAGPVEATAIGNLLVQAISVGELAGLGEAREVVAGSFPIERYEPAADGYWDEAYGLFRRLVA